MGTFIKNQKGVITFQFLVVLIIVLFFIISFFGLCLTLVNGSAVQYLTYASARKLSLGDKSLSSQKENAERHYLELRQKFFKNKYKSEAEWFKISEIPDLGFNNVYTDSHYRKIFYGASAEFISTRTNFKIPFLTDQDDGKLKTTVASYLGREVTKNECETFNERRMIEICAIYNDIGGTACRSPQKTPGDNGC